MNADFTRQRRNLIAVSVTLALLYSLDARITNISLFGNTLEFGDPDAMYGFIWICWGYFLYRFAVYSKESVPHDLVGERHAKFMRLLQAAAEKRILSILKKSGKYQDAFNAPVIELRYTAQERSEGRMRICYTHVGRLCWMDAEGVWHETEVKRGVQLSLISSLWIRFRADASHLLFTRYFSEYVLPYFVASVPIVIRLVR